MKRLFIIVASIIFLLGIGLGIYFLFFAKDASLEVSDGTQFGTADDAPLPTDNGPGTQGPVRAGEFITEQLVRITPGPVAQGTAVMALQSQAAVSTSSPVAPYETGGEVEIRYIERTDRPAEFDRLAARFDA